MFHSLVIAGDGRMDRPSIDVGAPPKNIEVYETRIIQ